LKNNRGAPWNFVTALRLKKTRMMPYRPSIHLFKTQYRHSTNTRTDKWKDLP